MVSIAAFQAVDLGSIPGQRILFIFELFVIFIFS